MEELNEYEVCEVLDILKGHYGLVAQYGGGSQFSVPGESRTWITVWLGEGDSAYQQYILEFNIPVETGELRVRAWE